MTYHEDGTATRKLLDGLGLPLDTDVIEWHSWATVAAPPVETRSGSSSYDVPITAPADVQAGDLLLVQIMMPANMVVTALNGYTPLGETETVTHVVDGFGNSATYRLALFWRLAPGGSVPVPTFTNVTNDAPWTMTALRGPKTVTAAAVATVADASSAATPALAGASLRVWSVVGRNPHINTPGTVLAENNPPDLGASNAAQTVIAYDTGTDPAVTDPTKNVAWLLASIAVSDVESDPTSPDTPELFEDTSLPATWTRRGVTAAQETWLSPGLRVANLANTQAYLHAAPTGDFDLILHLANQSNSATAMFGPMCVDAAGNGLMASYYSGYLWLLRIVNFHYPNAPGNSAGVAGVPLPADGWLRLRKVGTSYTASASLDGVTWSTTTASLTPPSGAGVPTRMGFGNIWNGGTTTVDVLSFAPGDTTPPDPGAEPPAATVAGWALDPDRTAALLGYTATHGRPSPLDNVGPLTCTVQLARTLAGDQLPTAGERFRLTLSEAVAAALGVADEDRPRFTGEITDGDINADGNLTTVQVTGVGRRARLGRVPVTTHRPQEPDGARVRRVLYQAAIILPLDLGTMDPGTVDLLEEDLVGTSAGALVDQYTQDSLGQLIEQRSGRLDWHDAEHRRGTASVATLAGGTHLIKPFRWSQSIATVVNDAEVTYGDPRAVARVTDSRSADPEDGVGPYAVQLDTRLAEETDAYALASTIVGRYAAPAWTLPDVSVDIVRTAGAQAGAVLALAHGDKITASGLPPDGPFTDGDLFVEGTTETFVRTAWRVSLSVADPAIAGVGLRWIDIPADQTWNDVDPALTWLDLATAAPEDI